LDLNSLNKGEAVLGKRTCIFCARILDPSQLALPTSQTREHVFARWIRDAVANKRMTMYEAGPNQAITQLRQVPLSNLVNSNVCKECNNGWMEKLESAVDPLVQRLIAGAGIATLLPHEIELLARWTAKTVAVLSFVTPQQQFVPEKACQSLHPDSTIIPQFRFFYCALSGDVNIEGAYLQLTYAAELPIVGETQVSGTRILLVINNQCLIADFPPIIEGFRYDLTNSPASQLWPVRMPAGRRDLGISLPASVSDVINSIGRSIIVDLDHRAIRV
jgi:hypothetical protein